MNHIKQEFLRLAETVYFDEADYLREKFREPSKVPPFTNIAENHLLTLMNDDKDHKEEKYSLCGMLGNCYRIVGQPQKAIHYLTLALKIAWEEENSSKKVVTYIRLGEAWKYNDEHEKAMDMFTVAMKIVSENELGKYNDFVLQHQGKCLMEMGKWDEAKQCFQEVLEIRKKKAVPSLIESTELSLNWLERKTEGG